MRKPQVASGYKSSVTENCERLLVTLVRGLGPWKNSVYLVGGLTPSYLVPKLPDGKRRHAGTGDVDIVIELQMLAETDAYHTLEENLKKMDFERARNENGQAQSWRWETKIDERETITLELLADNPEATERVEPLPAGGNISALNIPHASMVFDHYETKEISADMLGGKGLPWRPFVTPIL
jgi:hypothetical protein